MQVAMGAGTAGLAKGARPTDQKPPAERPNILVLMADDWSWPHAGSIGDAVVRTPTFDRFAAEGVLFSHAFVSSPSCTPSRCAVAAGQYCWRLEEGADLGGSLKDGVPVYGDLLRDAGYAVGHTLKGAAPSKNSYRETDPFGRKFKSFEEFLGERRPGQPFCFWFGSGDPHRPYEWQEGIGKGLDASKVAVPACLPDSETTRTDLCDYYARVQRFDDRAGRVVRRLEEMGELDNTLVVMTGDNGMPFPRCKATLYDTGTRVPLVVRWGGRARGGRTVDDFVSLTDLAPTIVEAAGLRAARAMTGRSLMRILVSDKEGRVEDDRDHVLVGRERHCFPRPSRAIRTRHFLYVRNVDPETWPNGKDDFAFNYDIDPSPTKTFMQEHRDSPDVAPLYALAFGPRATEELYDLRVDPDQLRNVVDDPHYANAARRLRRQLQYELRVSSDPRFPPEEKTEQYTERDIEGWKVQVNDALLAGDCKVGREALARLREKLAEIAECVPGPALAQLRDVRIWIEMDNWARSGAEYHPSEQWLRNHGRHPGKGRCVEIGSAESFLVESGGRQPMMVLHELAHAYHHQVLGHDHVELKEAYRQAVENGSYRNVRNWWGTTGPAYALSNDKEYFAENTEAFFGKNDFYPFTHQELREHDPRMYDLLGRIWGTSKESR